MKRNFYTALFSFYFMILPLLVCSQQVLSIKLCNNNDCDETIIRFITGATDGFDANYDAYKIFSINPTVPSLSTVIQNGTDLSINSYDALNGYKAVDLRAKAGLSGTHVLSVNYFSGNWNDICVYLEDLHTGQIIDFKNASAYTFYLADTTLYPRFLVHFQCPMKNLQFQAPSCFQYADASITFFSLNMQSFDVSIGKNGQWLDSVSNVTSHVFSNLQAGNYVVQYKNSDYGCKLYQDSIEIDDPDPLNVSFALSDSVTCMNGDVIYFYPEMSGGIFSGLGVENNSFFNPQHIPCAGFYTVTYTLSEGPCIDSAQRVIRVDDCAMTSSDNITGQPLLMYYEEEQIIIEGLSETEKGEWVLISADGKLYQCGSYSMGNNKISVAHLPSGVYLVSLVSRRMKYVEKLIKN